jgi:hypothetical protein
MVRQWDIWSNLYRILARKIVKDVFICVLYFFEKNIYPLFLSKHCQ